MSEEELSRFAFGKSGRFGGGRWDEIGVGAREEKEAASIEGLISRPARSLHTGARLTILHSLTDMHVPSTSSSHLSSRFVSLLRFLSTLLRLRSTVDSTRCLSFAEACRPAARRCCEGESGVSRSDGTEELVDVEEADV